MSALLPLLDIRSAVTDIPPKVSERQSLSLGLAFLLGGILFGRAATRAAGPGVDRVP